MWSVRAIEFLLDHPFKLSVLNIYRDVSNMLTGFKKHPNFQAAQGDVTDNLT